MSFHLIVKIFVSNESWKKEKFVNEKGVDRGKTIFDLRLDPGLVSVYKERKKEKERERERRERDEGGRGSKKKG